MQANRSLQTDVRNPLLRLPAAAKLAALPVGSRLAIAEILAELATDARQNAETCWKRHKAPMAAYWKAVAVYAGHTRRIVRSAHV